VQITNTKLREYVNIKRATTKRTNDDDDDDDGMVRWCL